MKVVAYCGRGRIASGEMELKKDAEEAKENLRVTAMDQDGMEA